MTTHTKLRCTCHDGIGLNAQLYCPRHSDVVTATATSAVLEPTDTSVVRATRSQAVMDAALDAKAVGRTIDDWVHGHTLNQPAQACGCDLPVIHGHDTGCAYHPAPIVSVPLQLLIAATQLITDHPTSEQWQTITKAIRDMVPLPFRSE